MFSLRFIRINEKNRFFLNDINFSRVGSKSRTSGIIKCNVLNCSACLLVSLLVLPAYLLTYLLTFARLPLTYSLFLSTSITIQIYYFTRYYKIRSKLTYKLRLYFNVI